MGTRNGALGDCFLKGQGDVSFYKASGYEEFCGLHKVRYQTFDTCEVAI